MLSWFIRAKDYMLRNERILSPSVLIAGFVVDSLTLRRADLLPETLLLYSYLLTVGVAIILLHLIETRWFRGRLVPLAAPWLHLVLQFTYGSLFSAFLIFYTKSASIAQSWPFLLVLLGVSVGTEILRSYNARFTFQLSVFYFAIFSFSIIAVPLALGEIDFRTFVISGALSLLVFALFLLFLYALSPARIRQSFKKVCASVMALYMFVNILYFYNVIPPIPLALKDIGIYHLVQRSEGGYLVEGESYTWPSLLFTRQTVHLVQGEPVYAYSSVFAPVVISANIVHRWEYWSDIEGSWISAGSVEFPVVGGRDGGYRGFSFKRGVFPGLWRVTVETMNKQRIGQIDFMVAFVDQAPILLSEVLP